MKKRTCAHLVLRPEADRLLEHEMERTGRKKQDIGHEWLMLAAKMKRLIPVAEENAA